MKIVLAPDSFKESLRAIEVATALERGIRRVLPEVECVKLPMADGGEGTLEALISARGGRRVSKTVMGPLGERHRATYGLLSCGKTAVVEMAAASGLHLVPPKRRHPLETTSFGTGELIRAALEKGVSRIIVGIGGSATNDGGAGMAQALGIRFYDKAGLMLADGVAAGSLDRVHTIDCEGRIAALDQTEILVACDVRNKLVGKFGASVIYAPQKGASDAEVRKLERNLRHFGKVMEQAFKIKIFSLRGGGAAGGLGAGLVAFAGGQLRTGVELVAELVGLSQHLSGADLVITGEGRIDSQTGFGKTPAGVAQAARRLSVPVIAVGGSLAIDARSVFSHGVDALESATVRDMDLAGAIESSRKNLCDAGERIAKWIILGQKLR